MSSQAGLFSAALTAFLGPVIAQLQTDNGQLSAQFLSILVLQGGPDPEIVPFLNSVASSLPRSTVFQPLATSVAINTLWFLSLILSLSAALLGILAKQWCREYLKWYSVLSPARENIMLRQLRYEAWQEWHVTSQIAAIPALLELSLILFFVGLVVYSWTLQVTVFGFVTSAVCIILIVTLASTLLPTFYRRSPYKSPMGLAFNRLVHVVAHQSPSSGGGRIRSMLAKLLPRHWLRIRDVRKFPIDSEHLRDWRTWDSRFTLDANLCELTGLLEPQAAHSREEAANSTIDAFEISLLVRALSWVRRVSNDDKLSSDIDVCLNTVYDTMRTPEDSPLHFHVSAYPVRLAIGWTEGPDSINGPLAVELPKINGVDDLNRKRGALYLQTSPHGRWAAQSGPYLVSMPPTALIDATLLTLARKAIVFRLRCYIACWVKAQSDSQSESSQRLSWAEKIARSLSLLRYVPEDYLHAAIVSNGLYTDIYANALVEAYRELAQYKAAFCYGLVPMIMELLRSLGEVKVAEDLGTCDVTRTFSSQSPTCPSDLYRVTAWNSIQWLSEQNCDLEQLRAFISQVSPVASVGSEDALHKRCHLLITAANNAINLVECQLVQWHAPDMLLPLHVPSGSSEGRPSVSSGKFTFTLKGA